jgi:hypothetical protein
MMYVNSLKVYNHSNSSGVSTNTKSELVLTTVSLVMGLAKELRKLELLISRA